MELLDLPQLARRSGIPTSLARYYRDRFVLFVPAVRIGRTLVHPPDAVAVLRRIHELAGAGASADEIGQALEQESPVAVLSAQPLDVAVAPGAAGVMNALAATLDDRGTRIESELTALRALLEDAAAARVALPALAPAAYVEPAPVAPDIVDAVEAIRLDLDRLRAGIDHLHAQAGQLASRDQLEWIGDVVSAALVRLPKPVPEPALEQRLEEVLHEIRRPRPSSDAVELRVAVERLSDYVHHRDAELRRSFQTLVSALRAELRTLRDAPADEGLSLGPLTAETKRSNVAGPAARELPVAPDVDAAADHAPSRPPRRLGQPIKPADGHHGDGGHAHGAPAS